MNKYVALLRGINVGGNKLIKMADLREVFTQSGFKNVRTYIQSGNVIFETRDTNAEKVTKKIEKAIYKSLGHEVTVILRTVGELRTVVKGNPFKSVESEENVMRFVTFLAAEPLNAPRTPFVIAKENAEILAIRNRTAFLACRRKPNGMFSFPNAFIEKDLGVASTTRNDRTVAKLLALAQED